MKVLNYFEKPYTLARTKDYEEVSSPLFCDEKLDINVSERNLVKESSSVSETKLVFVERTYKLPSFTEEELKSEVWKQIKDFPKYYISNLGRIYSIFSHKIIKPFYSVGNMKSGAGPYVSLYRYESINDSDSSILFEYRYSYVSLMREYFLNYHKHGDEIEVYIIHKNNNKLDCRLSNLEITSRLTFKKLVHHIERVERRRFEYYEEEKLYNDYICSSEYVPDMQYCLFVLSSSMKKFLKYIYLGELDYINILYKDNYLVLLSYDSFQYNIFDLFDSLFSSSNLNELYDSYISDYDYKDYLLPLNENIEFYHSVVNKLVNLRHLSFNIKNK